MKISERLTLIKAGYSRKEIDTMIAEEKEQEAANPHDASLSVEETQGAEEATGSPAPETAGEEKPAESVDYKKLWEDEKSLREQAQAANVRRNNKDHEETKEDRQKKLTDLVSSFL